MWRPGRAGQTVRVGWAIARPAAAARPHLLPLSLPRTRPQLRPEAVSRELLVDGSSLVLNFAAVDMRTLRAAVGTFCDLLGLATRTLEAFGPAATVAAAAAAGGGDAAAAGQQQQQQQPAAAAAAAGGQS